MEKPVGCLFVNSMLITCVLAILKIVNAVDLPWFAIIISPILIFLLFIILSLLLIDLINEIIEMIEIIKNKYGNWS